MIASAALLAAALLHAADVSISTSTPIREITIQRLDVFDPSIPAERAWPFKVANKLHIVTTEKVVRKELLLSKSDLWDPVKALESERNLRAYGIFRRVEVATAAAPGGAVDVNVRTQDAWTTNILFALGTEGGEHFFMYGAHEANLLGKGKSVAFVHSQFGPRIRNDFLFLDPRLLSTRYRFAGLYGTSNRGESAGGDIARPFFSLETPWAHGARWARVINEERTYAAGEEYSRFIGSFRGGGATAAVRVPGERALVQRVETGWLADKVEFTPTADTIAGTLPASRELSGPVLGYSWTHQRYLKETNINGMERDEDFNLGNELRVFAAWAGKAVGSDRDRFVFNVTDQQGAGLGAGRFALAQAGTSGRTAGGKVENHLVYGSLNLFWKTAWPVAQTWVAHAEAGVGHVLDRENQVILGGSTGLRGYKNYSFVGNKAVLFNLENRIFFPGEWFRLFRLGAAVFLDSGCVAPVGTGCSPRRFHSDVGVGLRVSPTRARGLHIMRFDVAYALNRGPGPDRWVVAVKGGQAFQAFSSANRLVRQSPSSTLAETTPGGFGQRGRR